MAKKVEHTIIKPHPGPQTAFLSTSAEITIFGGSAGGGKSFALLVDPVRHLQTPDFYAIMFRRQAVEITKPGGLVDASKKIYPLLGGEYHSSVKTWTFPSGAKIVFMGLDHVDDIEALRGVEISRLYFDELTTFEEIQFWYPQTRIRNTNGIAGKTKATTNPQSSGFVKDLIEWYLDDEGFAIAERSGVIRYFIRDEDGQLLWFDTEDEATQYSLDVLSVKPEDVAVTSFTFIRSSLEDNPSLGPEYRKRLLSMPAKERQELLGGNWSFDATTGTYFKREWLDVILPHQLPAMKRIVRAWDLAGTPVTPANKNPDWTAGVLMGQGTDNYYYIFHVIRFRDSIGKVKKMIKSTAFKDGTGTHIVIPQDPNASGKHAYEDHVKNLVGFVVKKAKTEKSKMTRFQPFASHAENGQIKIVKGDWNADFFRELEAFTGGERSKKDDQVDAVSDAFTYLISSAAVNTNVNLNMSSMEVDSIWTL